MQADGACVGSVAEKPMRSGLFEVVSGRQYLFAYGVS